MLAVGLESQVRFDFIVFGGNYFQFAVLKHEKHYAFDLGVGLELRYFGAWEVLGRVASIELNICGEKG